MENMQASPPGKYSGVSQVFIDMVRLLSTIIMLLSPMYPLFPFAIYGSEKSALAEFLMYFYFDLYFR